MSKPIWVTGTDTDVGKTFVTSFLMRHFQAQGKSVIPYKPVQTGVNNEEPHSGDTAYYQLLSTKTLVKEHLNSYSFKEPSSPHYAAALEGQDIQETVILQHIEQLTSLYEVVICEGAGGLFVPINIKRNYYFVDLIQQSQLPVVLVTRTKLGTINHTLLSIEALNMRKIPILCIVFNGFEGTELERNNIESIQNITKLPTIILPKVDSMSELKSLSIDLQFFERLINV